MTIENQFIQKVYYKTFLTEETSTPASEVLGEAYINESKMNSPTFLIFDLLKVNFIIKIKILKRLYLNGKSK